MDGATLAGLAALALVDSTSFGTLGIPVWMLVQRRVRAAAVLVHLLVLSVFYWLLGLLLLSGAGALTDALERVGDVRPLRWAQLALGVALLAWSLWLGTAVAKRRRAARPQQRHERWKQRVVGADASLRAVAVVALLAGLVEAASMLPYLGAVGLLASSGEPVALQVGVLAGYVALMAVPALLLLAGRLLAAARLDGLLTRLEGWLDRAGREAFEWVVGIVGFLLAASAAQALGLV